MHYDYRTSGVCARMISFDIEDGIIRNVVFMGGCPGNSLAVSKLVEGMDAKTVAEKLIGNPCGWRPTSCTDQLARGIIAAMENMEKNA